MEAELVLPGVVVKTLVTHLDPRGFFREVVRRSDPFFAEGFAQWSHSKMWPGVVKAWHVHRRQVDWWYCPIGSLQVALWDLRSEAPTYGRVIELILGEDDSGMVLRIPPGVAHGCKAIGTGPSLLFYITSEAYDASDEGRLPHDAAPYDWLASPPIR
jgi:dTDP-4-dehydrorhamnose 3,5-epimerase